MKKVELLAPAGNMDCLKAAIEAGCDAVYLGGKLFGARSFAGNFSDDELVEAVKYAHLYGVKVYLTINTIIYEREVERFLEYIRFVHKNNVDAVIIQDLGMFDLVRKKFPNLEIHASTQMHIHNYDGALFAKKMNIKRIVMARETPLELIKKIKKEIDIEVEVFIHGALCVSYSGQCLMSSLIGGRSGNRGTCTQCCRKPYDLYDVNNKKLNTNKYLLSTKDLCTLNNLKEIVESGVDSLKIEGRMKRAEYVYLVTSIYRKALDSYYETGKVVISNDDIIELKKIFNRDFTKGFMLGEENNLFVNQTRPNHLGIKIGEVISYKKGLLTIKLASDLRVNDGLRILDEKEDKGLVVNKMYVNNKLVKQAKKGDLVSIYYDKFVKEKALVLLTTDSRQINRIKEILKKPKRKVPIDIFVEARKFKPLYIKASDGVNTAEYYSDFELDKALNRPADKTTLINQLSKMGNTVYKPRSIEILLDDDIFINIKDINDARRKVIDILNQKRLYSTNFEEKEYYVNVPDFELKKEKSLLVNDVLKYEQNINNYDVIYSEEKEILKNSNVIEKLPRVIKSYKESNKCYLIGEVGGLLKFKRFDTDFSFNVVNSYAVAFLHELGARKITLSYELTLTQIKNIMDSYESRYKKHPNLEVIIDSYPEAMICKFDLNKMFNVRESFLVDEFKNKYRVCSNNGFMRIYNFKKLQVENPYELYEIGINSLRINLL